MNIHISDHQKATQLTGEFYKEFEREMQDKGWRYWHNSVSGDVEISSFGSNVNIVHRLSNPTVGDVRACANDERWKTPVDTSAQDVIDRKQDRKIKRQTRKIRRMRKEIAQARDLINRAVDLMDLSQLRQWEGARGWLEWVESDLPKKDRIRRKPAPENNICGAWCEHVLAGPRIYCKLPEGHSGYHLFKVEGKE